MSSGSDDPPRGLEVHLEELGQHSWPVALLTTLSGTHGSTLCRFVARPLGDADSHHSDSHELASATFPVLRFQDMDDTTEPHAWLSLAQEQLQELDVALVSRGWRRSPDTGSHWWSLRYAPA